MNIRLVNIVLAAAYIIAVIAVLCDMLIFRP